MIPTATITVADFAADNLAALLGPPPAGSSLEAADQWAAGVAQAAIMAKNHNITGPGTVRFEATGPAGTVVIRTAKMSVAQPIETERVRATAAARGAAERARARKVVQTAPSIAKTVGQAVKTAAAVVQSVSKVVGAAAAGKAAVTKPTAVQPTTATAALNAANRPGPSSAQPTTPARR